MTEQELQSISGQKYNIWCEKHPLKCEDDTHFLRATSFFGRRDLSSLEQSAFFFHELTHRSGLEFVVFSNAKIIKPTQLANNVVIVPCFTDGTEGQNISEPLAQLSIKMDKECRFIYDGWIPIVKWDEPNVRKAVRNINEALSIFSLKGRTHIEWEPKYGRSSNKQTINFEGRHFLELESFVSALNNLNENDRTAIYRSIGWLSQSLSVNEPAAQFLFSILAIEALAMYIEEEVSDSSPLSVLRSQKLSKVEKRSIRKICIDDILSKMLPSNPSEAIRTAYFDCIIGIEKRLKAHLSVIFPSDSEMVALLFAEEVDGKTLYRLRHTIAHGTADTLNDAERDRIHQRVWDAERIARRYIFTVLEKALNVIPPTEKMTANIPIEFVASSGGATYSGPTHMAFLYS